MCLITYKRGRASEFSNRKFINASNHNKDGLGVMWVEDGRVQVERVVGKFKETLELYRKHKHKETYALHLRYGTSGGVTMDNCHPFRVLDKDIHGTDLFMMHNGIFSGIKEERKDRSDTWHFVELYMKPMLEKNPELVHMPQFQEMLSKAIGSNNKLLFMDDQQRVVIVNEKSGADEDGCWLSSPGYVSNSYYRKPAWQGNSYYNNYGNNSALTPANKPVVPAATKLPAVCPPVEAETAGESTASTSKTQTKAEKEDATDQTVLPPVQDDDAIDQEVIDNYIRNYGEERGKQFFYDENGYLPPGYELSDDKITDDDKEHVRNHIFRRDDTVSGVRVDDELPDVFKRKPEEEKKTTVTQLPVKKNETQPLSRSVLRKASMVEVLDFVKTFPEDAAEILIELVEDNKYSYVN